MKSIIKKYFTLFFLLIFFLSTKAQITLSHNECNEVIKTMNHSCSYSFVYFARAFTLSDFGILAGEELVITHGELGLTYVEGGATAQFNIYAIDDDFPNSFDENNLIGQSQEVTLPYLWSPGLNNAEISTIAFDTPVIIPSNTERILVEVKKGLTIGGSGLIHVAGTLLDNDFSYYKSCTAGPDYISTENFVHSQLYPGSDYNFYITAISDINNLGIPFRAYTSGNCDGLTKSFNITTPRIIQNIEWDFDDFNSGSDNFSTELNPYHEFSSPGIYNVVANVTSGQNTYTTTMQISINPEDNPITINDIFACEDEGGSGISSDFDLSDVEFQITNGESGFNITYYDLRGNELPNPLPNPFTNTEPFSQTIKVVVENTENPCCDTEAYFELITYSLPQIEDISNLNQCETTLGSGIGIFNLQEVATSIIDGNTNISVDFFHENGQQILAPLDTVNNIIPNEETLTVIITNTETTCSNETTFKLIVDALPISVILPEIIGCDDNNDGISEYFDTSNVESLALENQTDMLISYFDSSGNQLPNPLPNPYTNTILNEEIITIRVSNNLNSDCFIETPLVLKTASQPEINTPTDKYACNKGNGFSNFDLSNIASEIIGNQSNLNISFSDIDGNEITNLVSTNFENTQPWLQTVNIRVEDTSSPICYSETSFNLIVNELPIIEIEESYFLCNLEPFLGININDNYDSYYWEFEDGTIISNTFEAQLINAGSYTVTIGKVENGILCENSYDFEFIRSTPPTILNVNSQELSSNNFIEIIASGDGDFEYSIDGINYQDSNYFKNINGGIYNISVRDKLGCGEDSKEIVLIDYPKFFTPNGDGSNDYWQIEGVSRYPISIIFIYDRYGKLLKQLSPNSQGWDGTYNGKPLNTDDYWFTANLNNEKRFSGHFTLKN